MKKRKYFVLIIILILIGIIVFFARKVLLKNNTILANTSAEERNFWNSFLNNSPYLGEIEYIYPIIIFQDSTEIVKLALATDDVKKEYINEDDIKKNFALTEGDGYKKSKKEIDKYLESLLNIKSFQYELIIPYNKDGVYMMQDKEYVYFTKIKVPEKIYIAMDYKIEDEEYMVEIYEYIVTEDNRSKLEEMLNTGEINSEVEKNNNYIISGTKKGEKIQISYKYTNKEDIKELDEIARSIPEGIVPVD